YSPATRRVVGTGIRDSGLVIRQSSMRLHESRISNPDSPPSIYIQRTHRLAEGDAAYRFRQQLGDRELTDGLAGFRLLRQRNRVGDYQLVELGTFQIADRRTRQHRMRAVRHHLACTLALESGSSGAQGAGGIDDVVDEDADLVLDLADDVHDGGFVGTRTTLVNDGQVGIVEPLGYRPRANHATHIGTDHDQLVLRVVAPDVGQQHRRCVHVVQRDVEKPLYLVGMQVDREHAVGAYRTNHLRRHLGRDRHSRRTRPAI